MSLLLVAAEQIPPGWERYGQFAGIFLAAFGYTATFTSLRVANDTLEAKLAHARLQTALSERIAEMSRHLETVEELLDAAAPEEKYAIHQHFSRIRDEREKLQNQAHQLESGLLSTATRSRFWADLMLMLMVLGVAGGTALVLLQAFVVAPFVFGIAPGAYLAYKRLNNATKEASGMAHTERMRQLEFDEKKLEMQEKQLEITEKRELLEMDAQMRRIELIGKQHELEQRISRPEHGGAEGQRH